MSKSSVRATISGQAVLVAELLQLALEPVLQSEGISVSTFDMLTAVQSGAGTASQAQIAAILRVSAPTLSEAVKAAVDKGLLLQIDDPNDRRAKILDLTPRGASIIERAMKEIEAAETVIDSVMGPDEKDRTLAVLQKTVRALAQHLNTP